MRVEGSNPSHEGVSFDIEYDIVGVSYENVDGENVNEKGCATTANGGICAFTGKDSWGTARTSGDNPKKIGKRPRRKVILIGVNLQSTQVHVRGTVYKEAIVGRIQLIVVDMLSVQRNASKRGSKRGNRGRQKYAFDQLERRIVRNVSNDASRTS